MDYKYKKPVDPLTSKVKGNIAARVNKILGVAKNVENKERYEYRRKDLENRFAAVAAQAFEEFIENNNNSYETLVGSYLDIETKRYFRECSDEIDEAKATVYGDEPRGNDETGKLSLFDKMEDPNNRFEADLLYIDLKGMIEAIKFKYPKCASILYLRLNYELSYTEISEWTRIPESSIYAIYLPKIKKLFKKYNNVFGEKKKL